MRILLNGKFSGALMFYGRLGCFSFFHLSVEAMKSFYFILTLCLSFSIKEGEQRLPKYLTGAEGGAFCLMNQKVYILFWRGRGNNFEDIFDNSYAISNKRNNPMILKVEPSDLFK